MMKIQDRSMGDTQQNIQADTEMRDSIADNKPKSTG